MRRLANKPNASRPAFTLMEVLVAVVVLALLVGMVSTVLTQTQRLVSISESGIRQNAAASSLSQAVRQYLQMATKNGPLCIADTSAGDNRPRLVLTTAGTAASVRTNDRGLGSFVVMGLVNNQADANGILWMPAYVLKRGGTAGVDVWDLDFSTLQGYGRRYINNTIIGNNSGCTRTVSDLYVPPRSIEDINLLWQVGTAYVTRLSITWTDGLLDANGNTNWYGRDIDGVIKAKDTNWASRTADTLDDPATWPYPEYKDAGGGYRALWTVHNQNYWPKAIKVRFTLRDKEMPKDFKSVDYEIIGTIGQ